jgi:DNA (cytosine-5)-methyltransferase 1
LSVLDVSFNLKHKFPYKWNFSDGYPAKGIDYHGTTVMTTFACGGGSTMGYKLSGYDVVAANDIDPQMAKVYKANHNTKQFFLCGIKELLDRDDLPQVDVLDGSPPCSVFSMAGNREGAWQKDKMFREGQAKQILDDLFFDFIDLAEKMQPKVVIAENVKGMLQGHAKWYTREVARRFKSIGYTCQVFLLNAARMGVPQKRERVFFIAHKTNQKVKLEFNEEPILFKDIALDYHSEKMTESEQNYWRAAKEGEAVGKFQTYKKLKWNAVSNTIVASNPHYHPRQMRRLNYEEEKMIGTFPQDYDFNGVIPRYLIGMSVPPVMMAQVADQVYNQIINNDAS